MEQLAFSVPEVAKALGVSRAHLYECVRRNEISHIRIGGRIVIPRKQLEQLLDPSETEAA